MKQFLIISVLTGIFLFIIYLFRKHMNEEINKGIQPSTISFLLNEEGKKNIVYKDSVGKDTVGIGHLVLPQDNLKTGDKISDEKIWELFKKDGARFQKDILTHIKFQLTQNQFDALFSLVYNIGQGGFDHSTVLKDLNSMFTNGFDSNEKKEISSAWLSWANKQPELKPRRQRELNLFFA